jgi:hypothetical protein
VVQKQYLVFLFQIWVVKQNVENNKPAPKRNQKCDQAWFKDENGK